MDNRDSFNEFRAFLRGASGIELGDDKEYLVANRLRRVMEEFKLESLDQLVRHLGTEHDVGLRTHVIDAMTTQETLWFRDNYPFEALKKNILPEVAKHRARPIRIWSAACSTGQEPYSISVSIQELIDQSREPLAYETEIVATDISPRALAMARAGSYVESMLVRGLSDARRERFFSKKGGQWEIKPEIRRRVIFHELNLKNSFSRLGKFHVIFCRNVLIYFDAALKRDLISRMAMVLHPGGYLFVGGPESLGAYSDAFETVPCCGGIVYRLKGSDPR